jgi:hypothetical protein
VTCFYTGISHYSVISVTIKLFKRPSCNILQDVL